MIIETYSIAVGNRRVSDPWQSNGYRTVIEWLAGYAYEWDVNPIATGKLEDKVNKIFDHIWRKEKRLSGFGLTPEDITVVLSHKRYGYLKFDPNYQKLKQEDVWQYISSRRPRDLAAIASIKGD